MTTVLVIEDEAPVRENIVDILTYEGFEVIDAANGEQGITLAREQQPAIIVCDIMMPEVSGYDVLQALRKESGTATIPFIFLTARAGRDDMRQGMELGADDYLTKPFQPPELVAAVRARLEKQHIQEQQRRQRISQRLLLAQEETRRLIAGELHGEVGALLTGLKMLLGMSRRRPPEEMKARLNEGLALVNELSSCITELWLDLRPSMLDDLGLLPALLQYYERFAAQTQVRVNFKHAGLEQR